MTNVTGDSDNEMQQKNEGEQSKSSKRGLVEVELRARNLLDL